MHGPSKWKLMRPRCNAALLCALSACGGAGSRSSPRFVPPQRAEYAITHEAAGQLYAPFLSTVSQVRCRLMAGTSGQTEPWALSMPTSFDQGANLVVIEVKSPGELLFRELVDGIWLASPVQVYLDLICGEGRCQGNGKALAPRKDRILDGEAYDTATATPLRYTSRLRARSRDPFTRIGPLEGVGSTLLAA